MVGNMIETVLALEGRLEATAVPGLQHQLNEVSLLGNEHLLVDMSKVNFIGSAALRAILVTAKRLAANGGKLAVFAPSQIAQIFKVSGLDAVVPVHMNRMQASEALKG
jgi:stage II sporulation protein AA (anti-sigma F factor antagonist)